jgi:hypothetical protein
VCGGRWIGSKEVGALIGVGLKVGFNSRVWLVEKRPWHFPCPIFHASCHVDADWNPHGFTSSKPCALGRQALLDAGHEDSIKRAV